MEIIKNEGNKLSFVIKGINYSYANAIRRSANEVPVLAIDEVEISKRIKQKTAKIKEEKLEITNG